MTVLVLLAGVGRRHSLRQPRLRLEGPALLAIYVATFYFLARV